MNKNHYIVLIALAVIMLGFGLWYFSKPATVYANLDQFSQCLRDKGLIMYGAAWCPHCQREKAAFGDAVKNINYVECPDNTKLCTDKKVTSYPTWITADGTSYVGEQGLEGLAKISSCELKKN